MSGNIVWNMIRKFILINIIIWVVGGREVLYFECSFWKMVYFNIVVIMWDLCIVVYVGVYSFVYIIIFFCN